MVPGHARQTTPATPSAPLIQGETRSAGFPPGVGGDEGPDDQGHQGQAPERSSGDQRAVEDDPYRVEGLPIGGQEQGGQDEEVEVHADPAGGPHGAGPSGRHGTAPERCDPLVQRQRADGQQPPREPDRVQPVPGGGCEEGQGQRHPGPLRARSVPPQGRVHVVAEPTHDRHLPAPPEVGERTATGQRSTEAGGDLDAHQHPATDGDVGEARRVEVQPDELGPGPQQAVDVRDRPVVVEVAEQGIGTQALLQQAHADESRPGEDTAAGEPVERLSDRAAEVAVAQDRARHPNRGQEGEGEQRHRALRRLDPAPAHVDDVGDELEDEVGQPDRDEEPVPQQAADHEGPHLEGDQDGDQQRDDHGPRLPARAPTARWAARVRPSSREAHQPTTTARNTTPSPASHPTRTEVDRRAVASAPITAAATARISCRWVSVTRRAASSGRSRSVPGPCQGADAASRPPSTRTTDPVTA